MANKTTNVSKLDFAEIREDLKEFLKNQDEFIDYDFEGSGISAELDLLAYNTHMNAMMAHMNINEAFLETAQVRSNVVANAFSLGYVPRSNEASKCTVDFTVTGTDLSPSRVIIPQGYKFSGRINTREYTFITTQSAVATKNPDNTFDFLNLKVAEGAFKKDVYTVDDLVQNQQFVLTSENADITSLEVTVYENASDTTGRSFALFKDIGTIGPEERAYFIKENQFGKYSVFFGDGIISLKPQNGAIVELKYIETNGKQANGITVLSPVTPVGIIDATISASSLSFSEGVLFTSGGKERETIEEIRKNAPLYHATQDRAVTANDYRILILNRFNQLNDCSVWGGEEANPPVYGKVFIAPVLASGERVSSALKTEIKNFLKTKNIGSILPEIVESELTYIKLFIGANYDPNQTDRSVSNLEALIRGYTENYDNENLVKFNGVFRSSKFLGGLDDIDEGIISSVVRTSLYKVINPDPTRPTSYNLKFPTKIYTDGSSSTGTIESSTFFVEGIEMKINDEPFPGDSSKRRLYFINATTGNRVTAYNNVGTIFLSTGEISLNNVKFDRPDPITIEVKPDSYDISPLYNQILTINETDVDIELRVDSVAVNGASGLSSYNAFTRHGDV